MTGTSGYRFHPQSKSGMHWKTRSRMLWPSSLDTSVRVTVSLCTVTKVLLSLPLAHCLNFRNRLGSSASYMQQQTAENLVRCVEVDMVCCLYTGTNVSVCVALAALLCCFSQPQEDGECKLETPFQQNIAPQQAEERDHQSSTGAESSATAALDSKAADQRRLSTQEGEPGCASACYTETKGTRVINRRNQMYREVARSEPPDIDRLSKSQLRQRLAFLSAYYPASCPSRGNLRQVFSFASWYTVAGF